MSRPAWLHDLIAALRDRYRDDYDDPTRTVVDLLCANYGHEAHGDDHGDPDHNLCSWRGAPLPKVEGDGIYRLEHSDEYIIDGHSVVDCDGRPCPLHNRSDHHMRTWPQHWRDDRGLMERICVHGVGHPDPDHLASVTARFGASTATADAVHGCDGCCDPRIATLSDRNCG